MFDNVVAGVLTGVLDDQTDRDVIALAHELDSPQGKLALLHVHPATAKPARDSGYIADTAKCQQALQRLAALSHELSAFEAVPGPVYARDPWNVQGEVEEHVEAVRRRVGALGHLEAKAGFGDPAHELARSGQSVDPLVIGGHDYRPIDHLLEQSTARRLADEVSTPLLVLPAAAAS